MKKWISLLVFCLLLEMVCSTAAATEGDWQYSVSGDSVTITDYMGNDSDIVIPKELGGKKVTAIGASAFERNHAIRNVTFEQGSSVSVIGYKAFYMTSLQNISFPGSLTTINERAFYACSSLQDVTFPANMQTIDDHAFYSCGTLSSITIPAGVTSIGGYAFSDCQNLSECRFLGNRFEIGKYVFLVCANLKNVWFPGTEAQWQNKIDGKTPFHGISTPPTVHCHRTITYAKAEHGSIKGATGEYPGKTVTVTVSPDSGYELDTLTYTDNGTEKPIAKSGGKYSFTVPAGDTTVKATFKVNPNATEKVTLKKLKSVKLKALSAKKLKVTWKKLSSKDQKKIQKIQIQYSTDKTFKTGVKTRWAKKGKASYTIKGLKKNTKYWVRIRAYKKSGNIIYVSKWVTKNKKTKKK